MITDVTAAIGANTGTIAAGTKSVLLAVAMAVAGMPMTAGILAAAAADVGAAATPTGMGMGGERFTGAHGAAIETAHATVRDSSAGAGAGAGAAAVVDGPLTARDSDGATMAAGAMSAGCQPRSSTPRQPMTSKAKQCLREVIAPRNQAAGTCGSTAVVAPLQLRGLKGGGIKAVFPALDPVLDLIPHQAATLTRMRLCTLIGRRG